MVMIVRIESYAYLVPYVESNERICLKTITPSRKAAKNYLGRTMSAIGLDDFEQDTLNAYQTGDFVSELTSARKQELVDIAHATLKPGRQVSINPSERDWDAIQRQAVEEGIPYQILMTSILHKYLSGRIYEIKSVRSDA